jgi:competence protein ComEA
MFYVKRNVIILCLCASIFLCACAAKEAVMLNAESGEINCTSFEDEKLNSFDENLQDNNLANKETENEILNERQDLEQDLNQNANQDTDQNRDQNIKQENYVYVYITGEILHPGVYQLVEDARIYEVLVEAGGYTPEADESACNLAGKVSDGMQIHIPNRENSEDKREIIIDGLQTTEEASEKINLNEASLSGLTDIPGIGTVKAEAIITYREQYGPFQSIKDIMNVEGIKNGTYEKIKDYIDVKN